MEYESLSLNVNHRQLNVDFYEITHNQNIASLIRLQNCGFHENIVPLHTDKKKRRVLRILNTIK